MVQTPHTLESLLKEVEDIKDYQTAKFMELETQIERKAYNHTAGNSSSVDLLEKKAVFSHRPTFAFSEDLTENTQHKSHFLQYVRKGSEEALRSYEAKALSTLVDPEGGFLVPEVLSEKIVTTLKSSSPLREIANVISISADVLEMLVDKGEADVGWVAEQGERRETETPELARLRIPVHEMYARPRATQKLLDDAKIDVENWLVGKICERMAIIENAAFFHGNGLSQPKGLLTYECVDKENWQWGKIEALKTGLNGGFLNQPQAVDCLIEVLHALKPAYLQGAVWVMSRTAQAAIRKLKDQTGAFLWQPGLSANSPSMLLGYPVVVSEEMPDLKPDTPSLSVAFGNFKHAYQIVERSTMTLLRDPYSAKPYVEFYATRRVGGDVVNFEALKFLNFAA